MALSEFSKLNVFAFLTILTQPLAETVSHVSENAVTTNGVSQPNIYPGYPQEYYTSQTYEKHTSQAENHIQTAVGPTETLISSAYRTPVSATKYIVPQVTKSPQGTHGIQGSNFYPYTVARVVPPSVTCGTFASESKCEEAPKKYHYGYRVTNPYTGTEFGHSEVHDGQIANGYYHVLLPDGRLQNVRYWAGPSGYHATITYETKY